MLLDKNVDTELRTAEEGFTSLHQAVRRHDSCAEIVRMLTAYGAKLEAKDKNNLSPLALAVQHSNREVVEALLEGGANPESCSYAGEPQESNFTPLLLAVSRNNQAAMEALVAAKVDLEAQTAVQKNTALMLAAKKGHWDLARILIICGADVNTRDFEKTTPLMEAAKVGESSTVKQLLEAGADRRLRDSVCRTHPLDLG